MPNAKSIPGIQRGPDFDREVNDPKHVEDVTKSARLGRPPEANDPLVEAAITAVKEVAYTFQRKLDVQYDTNSGLVVMTLYDAASGEEIRRLPPEEAIRMAQNRKNQRSHLMDSLI